MIDSPLSRRAHLGKLIELAGARGARVVIAECRATWEELKRLVDGYDGRCDYDVGDVKRIVVDTTAGDDQEKLVDIVLDFVKTSVDVY